MTELNISEIKKIDLTSEPVILGSGLTAYSVAKVFEDAGINFSIIDAGLLENKLAKKAELLQFSKKFSSPKLSSVIESYAFTGFYRNLNIQEKNFSALGSLAAGGLSNIWGAGLHHYSENENAFIKPSSHSKFTKKACISVNAFTQENDSLKFQSIKRFNEIYPEIELNSACKNLFINQKFSSSLIKFELPINAIKRVDKKNQDSKLIQDSWLGNFKQLTTFNSKTPIYKMSELANCSLISNTLIKKIIKKKEVYLIDCENIISGEKIQIRTKEIFCCMGVLATTKIVLEMGEKINIHHDLLNTPAAGFISFCYARNYKTGNLGLNNLSFKIDIRNENISGSFFPMTKNLYFKITQKWLVPKFIKQILYKLLFSRILVSNIFFPSSYGNHKILLTDKNKLKILGKNKSKKIKSEFKYILNLLKKNLSEQKIFILPIFKKILRPGEDIHYGGSLSHNDFPENKLCCNEQGELQDYQNFYICDSSSMSYLSGKPHSFNAMVNATVIAMIYIEKNHPKT